MLESSVGIPLPVVYPALADRISLLRDEAMDVIIVYQLVEIAREGTRKLINSRVPDDISRVNVAAVAEAFLIACSYSKSLLPRLATGIADHDRKDEGVIKNITEAQASWNAIKAELYKNTPG
jgi:hypothetical protein